MRHAVLSCRAQVQFKADNWGVSSRSFVPGQQVRSGDLNLIRGWGFCGAARAARGSFQGTLGIWILDRAGLKQSHVDGLQTEILLRTPLWGAMIRGSSIGHTPTRGYIKQHVLETGPFCLPRESEQTQKLESELCEGNDEKSQLEQYISL